MVGQQAAFLLLCSLISLQIWSSVAYDFQLCSLGSVKTAGKIHQCPTPLLMMTSETAHDVYDRRSFLFKAATATSAGGTAALLGLKQTIVLAAEEKEGRTLSVQQVKDALEKDFIENKYLVTGKLTTSIYDPSCRFTDPTTDVKGVKKYTDAVEILFDPAVSSLDLLKLAVVDDTHISAQWRLGGYLKFPWHPYVKPYEGSTIYTLGSKGLITSHAETWSISAFDAFLDTIKPNKAPTP